MEDEILVEKGQGMDFLGKEVKTEELVDQLLKEKLPEKRKPRKFFKIKKKGPKIWDEDDLWLQRYRG